jgi:hypothetical protein
MQINCYQIIDDLRLLPCDSAWTTEFIERRIDMMHSNLDMQAQNNTNIRPPLQGIDLPGIVTV